MKTLLSLLGVSILAVTLIAGCGPSEEELRQQELERQQAEQDSLEQVYEEQMQQMIQDSIAQVRQDSIEQAERQSQIQYSNDGDYAVQVQSWRSEEKANEELEMWKNRGFDNAFVVMFGNEETGDVWYRVRIGRVESKEMAENLQDKLSSEYDAQSWISRLN